MNQLSTARRAEVLRVHLETGASVRATALATGVAFRTALKLLQDVGKACADYQSQVLRNLSCQRVQCDEMWSFVYCKGKNVGRVKHPRPGYGDAWIWVGMCADCRLAICWEVGDRSEHNAQKLMNNLASRLKRRIHLTTDRYYPYFDAVEDAFGADVDYSTLVKHYSVEKEEGERRYSSSRCIGTEGKRVIGNPNMDNVSTSVIERQNLTMRMHSRRLTRLTNAFSKKLENHRAAVALHFMYYNFVRTHQAIRVTPAMEAGVAKKPWTFDDVIEMSDHVTLERLMGLRGL